MIDDSGGVFFGGVSNAAKSRDVQRNPQNRTKEDVNGVADGE